MSDKDQFTFGDDDDFPETDLSGAFSDGEHEADNPAPEATDEFADQESDAPPPGKPASAGGSRTRILLIVLLLVVAGGAGAYYFMGLGETTPSVPTVPVPAQKQVALPPQPEKTPAPAVAVAPPAKPVSVPVPAASVPPPVVEEKKPAAATEVKPAAPVAQKAAAPAPKAVAAVPEAQPAPAAPAVAKPVDTPQKSVTKVLPPPNVAPKQVADGAFALDAGSYLFDSNRDALVEKIKQLGYDPLVTPVDAKLDMTRLRLGTFAKDEVKEALDFARGIEPGSYSTPAGDGYVIYAGTFLGKGNIDKLTKRFLEEGIKVHPEPVQVVRTLSRIRFGSFTTKEDAMTAASAVGESGVKATVVKAK